jgi:hypothetical protein
MTTAEFRQRRADHAEDYRSMAGLVTAIGIGLLTSGIAALVIATL